MRVIVHGGAGSEPENPKSRQKVLDEAAQTGAAAESPMTAVESAIRILEDSPMFNAGVGSCVQADGIPRTDAGIMTSTSKAGAACNMTGVAGAIRVARYVLESTPHVMIAGDHAVRLAEHAGIETAVDLWSEKTTQRYQQMEYDGRSLDEQLKYIQDEFGSTSPSAGSDHDTVGAVAVDVDGKIVAGTSTGGRWAALAGRVGDVPQIGSGFYSASAGGASATGAGEDIAKTTLSREAVRNLEEGMTPREAAKQAIGRFEKDTKSFAGIIVADETGECGFAHCADAMQVATASRK
ncbi:isoaspartyl peptidase/L-asparaginase [Salinarchaeum sp. IM2453]|uniref:isoaspartyl peptidase/L-asparaginase n=1 Tax=Salinarchaeum sp. IM2453 TaxID=2862870 RepID=UPI001C83EB25|nr:isoaspartyl peptidase/L-asparaginase [Salinarchaeum sp. IM2453]QZA89561.1 isoaspartyl peptidase/L-asparaginase [Salinarchaeum sp. IM2453]